MVVPLAARWVAAAVGIALVLTGWQSVIGTLIVPRPVGSWLTHLVDRLVLAAYMSVTRPVTDWVKRDRILATQAAAVLVGQLVAWLGIFLAGFTLALWPSPGRNISSALADAGSSIFTLGFAERRARPGRDRLHRGRDGHDRDRAADRLPADAVFRLQPAGDPGGAARLAPASRAGDRNCSPARTTRSALARRPSTRCPTCTSNGSAGRRTWRRVTRPTCRLFASARRSRTHRG